MEKETIMTYREMTEADILSVVPLYIDYYNTQDGDGWTFDTNYKRIHEVWRRVPCA